MASGCECCRAARVSSPSWPDWTSKSPRETFATKRPCRQACRGVAAVIHCAAYVRIGWSQRSIYEAINVDGTQHVARACRAESIRLVHVSSTDVFGRCSLREPTGEDTPFAESPRVPYVETKRWAEAVVADEIKHGLDAVIVNPAFMLGPWDWKPSSGQLLLNVAAGRAILALRGWLSLCDCAGRSFRYRGGARPGSAG